MTPMKGVKAWVEGPLRPKEISRYRDSLGQIRAADNTPATGEVQTEIDLHPWPLKRDWSKPVYIYTNMSTHWAINLSLSREWTWPASNSGTSQCPYNLTSTRNSLQRMSCGGALSTGCDRVAARFGRVCSTTGYITSGLRGPSPPGFNPLRRGWVYRPAPEAPRKGECRWGPRHFWNCLSRWATALRQDPP